MDYLVICATALIASGLTLFSGFGLGTLLMPVVALFFSVDLAIAITAIVHLANNGFKLVLLGDKTHLPTLLKFGIPAVLAATFGAVLLSQLTFANPLYSHELFAEPTKVLPIQFVIGTLIIVFVVLELSPRFSALSFDAKFLPLGGILSGFFGGLSGHQGAFRSMFLLKAGLDKQAFIATGVVIAVIVDITRLSVYGWHFGSTDAPIDWALVTAASISAFIGAYVGAKVLQKVTLRTVQLIVSALLLLLAVSLLLGLI